MPFDSRLQSAKAARADQRPSVPFDKTLCQFQTIVLLALTALFLIVVEPIAGFRIWSRFKS